MHGFKIQKIQRKTSLIKNVGSSFGDIPMAIIPLVGVWRFLVDPGDIGVKEEWYTFEYFANNWNLTKEIGVPHNWNAMPGLERYEGVGWYFKEVRRNTLGDIANKECVLHFKGVNYHATVWWNGRYLGSHEGGFLPFEFKVPLAFIQSMNIITVRVENTRKPDRIPGMNFDWYNWGGIHRAVLLGIYNIQRIKFVHIETTSLERDFALLRVRCGVTAAQALHWQILEGSRQVAWGKETLRGIKDVFRIKVPNPRAWDPQSPFMYDFVATLSNSGEVFRVKFGIRTISIHSTQLLLNGKPVKLRGINLHEEQVPYGRCQLPVMRAYDVQNIRALGFNAIRSAHYPHDETLPQLCDELGLLLLEEIPVYWDCDFGNPKVFRLAAKMLKSLVYRDFNHPSVIMWSCGNEIPVERPECARFMRQAMKWVRHFDTSRIVFYVGMRFFCDTTRKHADINAINEYFGWYYLSTKHLNFFLDVIYYSHPQKPWIITEFGAGAKLGFRDTAKEPAKFSEEKQAAILAHTIRILNAKPYVAGWFIWVYRDFRSPLRTNQYQQGFNRKGIVSEKNEKKLIARMISRVMHEKERHVSMSRFIAPFLLFGLRFAEKAIYLAIGRIISLVQHKKIDQYYSSSVPPRFDFRG